MQLDGMSWGPTLDDGRRSLALTFENDEQFGIHFELFTINVEDLEHFGEVQNPADARGDLLQKRIAAVSVTAALLIVTFFAQLFCIKRLEAKSGTHGSSTNDTSKEAEIGGSSSLFNFSNYALVSAMLNSFLVGGLTFGYSGMVLMLRKEGVYAEYCSCGSFW
jgi:hypothetical protein